MVFRWPHLDNSENSLFGDGKGGERNEMEELGNLWTRLTEILLSFFYAELCD